MFSVPVSDEQYLRAAELAGVPSWCTIPSIDPEIVAQRLGVEIVLIKALRVGLRALEARAQEKAGRTIDGYSRAALAVLYGDRAVTCDACDATIDRGEDGQVGGLRLAGDELEFICDACLHVAKT